MSKTHGVEETPVNTKRRVTQPFEAKLMASRRRERFVAGELLTLINSQEAPEQSVFIRINGLRASRGLECRYFYEGSKPTINPMTTQNINVGRDLVGIVGVTLNNVTNAIQQLSPERADLRSALEELKKHAEPLLKELPKDAQEEAARNFEDFTKEAATAKPRKGFLDLTSKGLIEAAGTVAAMAPAIIATVDKLRPLLGF